MNQFGPEHHYLSSSLGVAMAWWGRLAIYVIHWLVGGVDICITHPGLWLITY